MTSIFLRTVFTVALHRGMLKHFQAVLHVLEGEDTLNQAENAGRRLSEEELKAIRKHQDEQ